MQALLDLGVNVAVMGKTAISTPDFPTQVIADPDFKVSVFPPYSAEHLKSVDVSDPFVDFMASIGLVAKA